MKPEKEDKRQPFNQADLDKLPKKALAKNMRDVEDIMAEYIAHGESELSPNEQRLLDLKVFQKTGKHIGKFKETKKPKVPNVDVIISADGDKKGQKNNIDNKIKVRKEPKIASKVITKGVSS